ncbi:MAG: hypothetical protein ACTSRZ_12450 [Promethearchaeota archaeon]
MSSSLSSFVFKNCLDFLNDPLMHFPRRLLGSFLLNNWQRAFLGNVENLKLLTYQKTSSVYHPP